MRDLSSLEAVAVQKPDSRTDMLAGLAATDLDWMTRDWRFLARPAQLPPEGNWFIWLVMAGRGFGKTRAGAEWVRGIAEGDASARIALVGASLHEARAIMVEGESGLLAIAPPGRRPLWQPARRQLFWPNGATATIYGAAEPEGLRGPQHSHAWADEIAKWPRATAAWDNLVMGLRLGVRPCIMATTTPRPVALIRRLASDPAVRITRGRTAENRAVLPPQFLAEMARTFGGTRLGRQELGGELVLDVEGALWTRELLDRWRVPAMEGQQDRFARLDAMDAAMTAQALRSGRPPLDGAKGGEADPARAAFTERYLRRGIEAGVELKSFSGASGGAGGYAVPREIDQMIEVALKAISPIRAISNVVRTGSAGYRKLVTTGGVVSGWASEVGARPDGATPTFQEIAPPSGELYANPSATQAMLDDALFDVEGWLSGEIAQEFARAEGAAFVNGDGTNKPKGFLKYTATSEADGARAFGSLQYIASGQAGAFPASNPQDKLIDLVQALKAPYRQGATFVMNSATLARIRKFKTSDGAFLWQPSLAVSQPATLLGYPVIEAEDMPDIAADSLSIAFGNFQHGYVIAERNETSILRDPFTNKPFVQFYAVKRIGGAVTNSEAIKLMKFAAS